MKPNLKITQHGFNTEDFSGQTPYIRIIVIYFIGYSLSSLWQEYVPDFLYAIILQILKYCIY